MRAALVALLGIALLPAAGWSAPDCGGGSIVSASWKVTSAVQQPGRFRFTITRPRLHAVAMAGQDVTIVFTDESGVAERARITLPGAHLVASGAGVRYDGHGGPPVSLRIRDEAGQADTVRFDLHTRSVVANGPRLRVEFGGACNRTCVVDGCSVGGGRKMRCRPSRRYVPFPDQDFGALRGATARATSGYCGLALDTTSGCDWLVDERCVLPFPSSQFLQPDASTPTGLRIHYPADALPANAAHKHIDPTDWNTLDGFSPGPVILALFPDTGHPVDAAASGLPFYTDYAASLAPDSPSILLRADGTRVEHFVEMDLNTDDVTKKATIMRPGRRLDDGTRYLVAYRHLVDTDGTPIAPRLAFRALRDAAPEAELRDACGEACAAAITQRRTGTFEDVFAKLAAAGVARDDLVLAWDFATASTHALTDWIVAVRDQAFALGTPQFTVTQVEDGGGAGFNDKIFRRVEGTFRAPLFETADAPGARLELVDGVPAQNGWATVPFVVDIPWTAVNPGGAPKPGRGTLWGHGLLGDRFQVDALWDLADVYGFVIGGVDMQGMSNADVGAIVPAVQDYSLFHIIPERLHQGFLNHLLLGRLMQDPVYGFDSDPAFLIGDPATPAIDTSQVYYSGGSQGGIFGTAIMSIATNFDRGFLAVPGANYSTLLHRSIDFNPFLQITRLAYPDRLDEQLNLALVQQLWDRAEPQGYYPHLVAGDLSDPPVPHKVLMHMATYDCEVTNVATEIMVRSLGFSQVVPAARSFFDIPERAAPFDDSAFVEINPQKGFSRCHTPGSSDAGAACTTDADCPGAGDPASAVQCASGIPPLGNVAPAFNNRAHGSTGVPTAGQQIDRFLRTGGDVENFCSGPCDPQ
jgi:hypothetical protein